MSNFDHLTDSPDAMYSVSVEAQSPFTEVYVIDSSFNLRASFAGSGEIDLPVGTYAVRFQQGKHFEQKQVLITEDTCIQEYTNNETVPDAHEAPSNLAIWFEEQANDHGKVIVSPSASNPPCHFVGWNKEAGCPAEDITLQAEDTPLQEFAGFPDDPDTDVLIVRVKETMGSGHYDFFIPVLTHGLTMFLQDYGPHAGTTGPILVQKTDNYVQSRESGDFDSRLHAVDLASQATAALVSSRIALSDPKLLHMMVNNKWGLPWHGILAAFLHMQRPEPNVSLLATMYRNLTGIYGDAGGADLAALGHWLAARPDLQNTPPPPIDNPPLLHQSWKMLIDIDALNPGSVIPRKLSCWLEPGLEVLGSTLVRSSETLTDQALLQLANSVSNFWCDTLGVAALNDISLASRVAIGVQSDDRHPCAAILVKLFGSGTTGLSESSAAIELRTEEIESVFLPTVGQELCRATGRSLYGLLHLIGLSQDVAPGRIEDLDTPSSLDISKAATKTENDDSGNQA